MLLLRYKQNEIVSCGAIFKSWREYLGIATKTLITINFLIIASV